MLTVDFSIVYQFSLSTCFRSIGLQPDVGLK